MRVVTGIRCGAAFWARGISMLSTPSGLNPGTEASTAISTSPVWMFHCRRTLCGIRFFTHRAGAINIPAGCARSAAEGVAERVEEAFLDLGGLALASAELLVQRTVVMWQMGRDDHAHHTDQVAATSGAHVGDTESVQLELPTGLSAGGHLERM